MATTRNAAAQQPTQCDIVLDHLRRAEYITDSQAVSLYGIGQVAGVVHKLRKRGYRIKSTFRKCIKPRATRYAEYRLVGEPS